ncbi:MAG: hypothetical protein H0U86_03975 [Chloroflexi bacterium]|nr:hypothetical protein [Chloroflexota bacterium]
MRLLTRLPWLVTVALVVGIGISQLILTVGDWHLRDAGAYWEAAMRLREGEPLYPVLTDTEASEVYRYAPWLAWAWVPLTLLPREAVHVIWSIVLLVASAAALSPLARRRAWLAVALFLPILVGISAIGNVQPLIVAGVVLGVERRSGPLWIAAGASLKAVPLLLVITYLGRRQWLRALMTLALTGALVAPMLLYDLSSYPTGAGGASMFFDAPLLHGLVVAGGILASVRLAKTRWAWLASSATVALALPRFFVYDLTFLMTSFAEPGLPSRNGPKT